MKTRILHIITILLFVLFATPALADVITFETFGEVAFDSDPNPFNPEYHGKKASFTFWWLVDSVQNNLTSENGTWVAGSDTSIRINNYILEGPPPKTWTDTSSLMALIMTAPTRYSGAWDTTILTNINIESYELMELKFGWGKRPGWVNPITDQRGLKVEYRIDGGSWVMLDTTKLENPLEAGQWSYADELYIDDTGDIMDIMFTAYNHQNQFAIDDILLVGEYNPSGINSLSNSNFKIYPNPIIDKVNIELRSGTLGNYKLVNLDGAVVLSGIIENGIKTIDISELSKGLYILNVTSDAFQENLKLAK